MCTVGYDMKFKNKENHFEEVMKYVEKDYDKKVSWRSDLQNFEKDKSMEFIRYKILKKEISANKSVLKKCFLIEDYSLSNLREHYKSQ